MICGQPGLAKFGIALGLGPRDRGFESRSPDQKSRCRFCGVWIFFCGVWIFLLNKAGLEQSNLQPCSD